MGASRLSSTPSAGRHSSETLCPTQLSHALTVTRPHTLALRLESSGNPRGPTQYRTWCSPALRSPRSDRRLARQRFASCFSRACGPGYLEQPTKQFPCFDGRCRLRRHLMHQLAIEEAIKRAGQSNRSREGSQRSNEILPERLHCSEMKHGKSVRSLETNQLRVVCAPETRGSVGFDRERSGPDHERTHDQGWMTKHTDQTRAGQQPQPSFNRPDCTRVLEPPGTAGTDVWFDKRPGPFLVGTGPRNLAIRRRVPRSARLGQQRIVQVANRFVLLVSLPVVWRRVVDLAQIQPRGLQAAGQQ